jgi:hypothetical protein
MNVFLGSIRKAVLVCVALAGFQQFCHAELERFYGCWAESGTYNRTIVNSENVRMNILRKIFTGKTSVLE